MHSYFCHSMFYSDLFNIDLQVFKTDIFSMESLEDIIEGSYAVISCLGAKAATISPVTLYTDSGEAILGAMKRMGVKRFICITSWHTKCMDIFIFLTI